MKDGLNADFTKCTFEATKHEGLKMKHLLLKGTGMKCQADEIGEDIKVIEEVEELKRIKKLNSCILVKQSMYLCFSSEISGFGDFVLI